MRIIKATEFVNYLYCERAWWYQIKGASPDKETEISDSMGYHRRYGRQILLARWMEFLGWSMVLAALGLTAVALTMLSLQ
jgi:hypothetical protein